MAGPGPSTSEIPIRVSVCGVRHTEPDEVEGGLRPPRLPVVPGHQVVRRVGALCEGAGSFRIGDRVGVAWIHSARGNCGFCPEPAPRRLNALIDTTPAWTPVVKALENLERGGRLVINAIRKVDVDKDALMTLDYPTHLWLEKEIKSVANVVRPAQASFSALRPRSLPNPRSRNTTLPRRTGLWSN